MERTVAKIEVRLARALQTQADLPGSCAIAAATAREALNRLAELHPQIQRFVLDDQQRLRRHVNIFINDALIDDRVHLSDRLHDGDRLHILPAVSGGTA